MNKLDSNDVRIETYLKAAIGYGDVQYWRGNFLFFFWSVGLAQVISILKASSIVSKNYKKVYIYT